LPTPYPLQINEFSFEFTTDQGISYCGYFKSAGYLFDDYPVLAPSIFTFDLLVQHGDPSAVLADLRIGCTVAEILGIFFQNNSFSVVYLCDSVDGFHFARMRLFNYWFWKYANEDIVKRDNIATSLGIQIQNSLLIHRDNPQFDQVIAAFEDLNAELDK